MSIDDAAERLAAELAAAGLPRWREIRTVATTGSTNADLRHAAGSGDADGIVLVADHQAAGRGRRDRTWSAPPGTSLAVSAALRPTRVDGWSWLPLLTGVAVADAVRATTGVPAELKWPNDVVVADRKLAGILCERAETATGPAVIIGVGLNTWLGSDQLPVPTATSLRLCGADDIDEVALLISYLVRLDRLLGWFDGEGTGGADDLLRDTYLNRCTTLGRRVRVELGGRTITGSAVDIDADGALRLRTADGVVTSVVAGDVVHLRPGD